MTKEEKSRLKELNDKIKNYNKKHNSCPDSGICPGLNINEYHEWVRLSLLWKLMKSARKDDEQQVKYLCR